MQCRQLTTAIGQPSGSAFLNLENSPVLRCVNDPITKIPQERKQDTSILSYSGTSPSLAYGPALKGWGYLRKTRSGSYAPKLLFRHTWPRATHGLCVSFGQLHHLSFRRPPARLLAIQPYVIIRGLQ